MSCEIYAVSTQAKQKIEIYNLKTNSSRTYSTLKVKTTHLLGGSVCLTSLR